MYNTYSVAERLTAGSESFHCTPEESRRTLPIQQWGTLCQCSQYQLHSQGKEKTKRNPTTRKEVLRSSPRWAGSLRQRGHTRIHSMGCSRLHSVKGDNAMGTENYKCHGHIGHLWQPEPVFGSGQMNLFILFHCSPHSRSELGLPYLFLSIII